MVAEKTEFTEVSSIRKVNSVRCTRIATRDVSYVRASPQSPTIEQTKRRGNAVVSPLLANTGQHIGSNAAR